MNHPEAPKEISIIGAGLVGSLLSVLLKDLGYNVKIFDKRPYPNPDKQYKGRSINLALSHRGIKALQTCGLADEVLSQAIPMLGRMIHDQNSNTNFQAYHHENKCIYSISRATLNKHLLDKAINAGVEVHLDSEPHSFDFDKQSFLSSGKEYHYQQLFVSDGAYSSTRESLKQSGKLQYSQHILDYGYKEIEMLPQGSNAMEKNALHIWPRHDFMLIALPNPDGSFTGTLFLKFEGNNSFAALKQKNEVRTFFEKYFPDAIPHIHNLEEDFLNSPVGKMVTIDCKPWSVGNVCLMGDAAHAIVPFYGQGMNAGFEGANILYHELKSSDNILKSIETFATERYTNTQAIAQLALYNFTEMRDLVNDEAFLLRKKIESWLKKQYPHTYKTIYEMVTFSHSPYSHALQQLHIQNKMFEEIFEELPASMALDFEQGGYIIHKVAKKYYPHIDRAKD